MFSTVVRSGPTPDIYLSECPSLVLGPEETRANKIHEYLKFEPFEKYSRLRILSLI